jgi:hypothetical protein
MCRVPTPIDARSMADRAPKAPRSTRDRKPDGRSAGARRFRAIVEAFSEEIGGQLSESELGLVRQAAALALRCEQLQAAIVRGEVVDDDLLVRISGTSKRLLGAIAVKSDGRKPAGGNAFQEYLAKHAAAQAADDTDED